MYCPVATCPPALCQGTLLDCHPKATTAKKGKIPFSRKRLDRLLGIPLATPKVPVAEGDRIML